jgi:hypothetical protein
VRPSHVLCEKFYGTGCLEKINLNSKINCLNWMTYMNQNVSSGSLWSFPVTNHDDSEGGWNVGLPPLLGHLAQPGRQSRQLYVTAALNPKEIPCYSFLLQSEWTPSVMDAGRRKVSWKFPRTLAKLLFYQQLSKSLKVQVIFVDDGLTDSTLWGQFSLCFVLEFLLKKGYSARCDGKIKDKTC